MAERPYDPVLQTVDELKFVSAKLNAVTDDLNEAFTAAENAIQACGVAIYAEVDATTEIQKLTNTRSSLEFTKMGHPARWRLAYTVYEDDDPFGVTNPVVSLSRYDRRRLAGLVPALWLEILEATKQELSKIEAATDILRGFVFHLEQARGEK